MKIRKSKAIVTSCDNCHLILREDIFDSNKKSKSILHHSVLHIGEGKHKCKKCFKNGFKNKWKYILHPIEEEPKCKS